MYLWARWFMTAEFVEVPVFNDIESDKGSSSVLKQINEKPLWMKVASFIVLTLGYLGIGFSRFILGVHSLN